MRTKSRETRIKRSNFN